MPLVAEGAETPDQEPFLRDHACDEMQGFLFGKPVPPEYVPDLLRAPLRVSPPLQPEPFTDRRISKALRYTEPATVHPSGCGTIRRQPARHGASLPDFLAVRPH